MSIESRVMAGLEKKGSKSKGFASMDEERKKRVASEGGHASAKANTSNRGFASMDKNKQREISSMGGKASKALQRPARKYVEGAEPKDIISEKEATIEDLNSLEQEQDLNPQQEQGLSFSETDEDEDEGLGDGNLGRSKGDVLGK